MNAKGYSLIEVLIAAGVVAVGIAAAALLSNSLLLQEEENAYVTAALNIQEQAGRLYRQGISTSDISTILQTNGISFTTNAAPTTGTESVNCSIQFLVNSTSRTNTTTFVRVIDY